MKTSAPASIPVGRQTATRFAALTEEQKRVVRMRVAIEIGRLTRRGSRAQAAAEFRKAVATIGDQARRRGLTLRKIERMVDGGHARRAS